LQDHHQPRTRKPVAPMTLARAFTAKLESGATEVHARVGNFILCAILGKKPFWAGRANGLIIPKHLFGPGATQAPTDAIDPRRISGSGLKARGAPPAPDAAALRHKRTATRRYN
jgi:hypothetical protein